MKTSKDKFSITALLLTFVGVLFIGIVIVAGIIFFNEKIIVVPDDELTITAAVGAADPGDIILVKASGGPYNEEVTITKEKIKLIGIGKEKPVLDGMNMMVEGITIGTTSGILVQDFIVQNFDFGINLNGSESNMMKGNTVNGNGLGIIFLNGSESNMMKGNTVNGSVLDGIFFSGDSNNNNVFFNRAFDNGDGNITFDINDQNMLVPLNNFKGNKCGTSSGANVDCGN